MIELRWFTSIQKREDFTSEEWAALCQYYMDPCPPLNTWRRLQYRIGNNAWREIDEVKE